eukprot:1535902-Karenia_brevis.AAC.1
MREAAMAAAQVVLTPRDELTVDKSLEAQALIEKCKNLSREDVIVDWPREYDEVASKIKKEKQDSRDASSSS